MWLLWQFHRMGINHEAVITEEPGHAVAVVRDLAEDVDTVIQAGLGVDVRIACETLRYRSRGIPAYFAAGLKTVFTDRLGCPRE